MFSWEMLGVGFERSTTAALLFSLLRVRYGEYFILALEIRLGTSGYTPCPVRLSTSLYDINPQAIRLKGRKLSLPSRYH